MRLTIAPLVLTLLVATAVVNSSDAARKKLRGFQRDYEATNQISRPVDLASAGAHSIESGPRVATTNDAVATRRTLQGDLDKGHSGADGTLVDQIEEVDIEEADLKEEEEEDGDEEERSLVETMVMSAIEKSNAGYVQSVRKSRGLPQMYFSPDLVKEARRWSKHMMTQGCTESRPSLDLNVAQPWKKISEITGRYNSVQITSDEENEGAIVSMINNLKTKDKLLNACYNRIGVGIVKASDGSYFVTVLTKQA